MGGNTALTVIPPPPDYIDAEFYEIPAARTLTSKDIITPIYRRRMEFHQGGVFKMRGYMESRKSSVMIAYAKHLIDHCGYHGFEVFANAWLSIAGSHWLDNAEFLKLCIRAFADQKNGGEVGGGRFNHTIWLAFEADDLWTYVDQADKQCATQLRKLAQNYKRNIHFCYEMHEGKGVPAFLRQKTEISIKPRPDDPRDGVDLLVSNGHYGYNCLVPIERISVVNKMYRRFDELY